MAKLENLTGAAEPPKPHGSASSGGAVSDASESLSLSGFPRSRSGPPMTLGNMRANGVRSLDVCCWQCHHRAILSADPWSNYVPVPSFGPRMVCTRCGIIGADARPNWREQPARLSAAGTAPWR
jgi:hypothetical protein